MSKELHTKLSDEEWEKLEKLYNEETEPIDNAKPIKRVYYEIEKIVEHRNGIILTESFCLVESKEVAEHWCKIHKKYTYNEIEVDDNE